MTTIADFMTADHKTCDDKFAAAEETVADGNWNEAAASFNAFRDGMTHHFKMEEEVIFPTLASSGGPSGPVQVMLMEHEQIRGLLEQMVAAVAQKDAQTYSGLSETLLIVMQQHNYKEENILYPIVDQFLADQREALFSRMKEI